MDHADHVNLLRHGVAGPGGVWADLGAGSGAFTLALAELIEEAGQIYAIDKDRGALNRLVRSMQDRFPVVGVTAMPADFSQPLKLPPLDGVVMANSLHFQREKLPVLKRVRGYLRPGGRLLLVEYDTDRGNPWVPYPLSYQTWEQLAVRAGFEQTRRLASRPSHFLHRIYAAISVRFE